MQVTSIEMVSIHYHRSRRSGNASWGIVALVSVLSIVLGILIGKFILSSGDSPKPAPANENQIAEATTEESNSAKPNAEANPQGVKIAAENETPAKSAEEELFAGIQSIINTLDTSSPDLFIYSYLPDEIRYGYEEIIKRENKSAVDSVLSKKIFNEYRIHLESALTGKAEINPTETFAVVTYKVKEVQNHGLDLDQFNRKNKTVVEGEVYPGLGDDLTKMLNRAAAMLENDQLSEFVDNVFPTTELLALSAEGAQEKLLSRISNPSMKEAMLRDLKAASQAEAQIEGTIATVTIPPLINGDADRTVKFELVEGNWRFIDLSQKESKEISELVVKLPASMKNENSGLRFVFSRTNKDQEWRIEKLPANSPKWYH